jgi:hypothetical protein
LEDISHGRKKVERNKEETETETEKDGCTLPEGRDESC